MKKVLFLLFILSSLSMSFISCGGGYNGNSGGTYENGVLDTHYLNPKIGEEIELNVSEFGDDIDPDKITWSPSSNEVFTVNKGNLKIIGFGNATVYAHFGDKSIKYQIDVVENKISFSSEEISLKTGENHRLSMKFSPTVPEDAFPDGTFTWKSSNPNVAAVSNKGTVEAISEGETVITVSAFNGRSSASCKVKVELDRSIADISLEYTKFVMNAGDTETLTATVTPAYADKSLLKWKTSNSSVLYVNNGVIRALKPGTATVTAYAPNDVSKSCTVTVKDTGEPYAQYIRVDKDGVCDDDGDYILFGTYPQSKVENEELTSSLTNLAGKLPTKKNSQNWTSYKYYNGGSNETDFMWYIDVEFEGQKYRGVYFNAYRWMTTTDFTGSTNNELENSYTYGGTQLGSGYEKDKVHWFKYDYIKWKIIKEIGGTATLFCETAIDSTAMQSEDGAIINGEQKAPDNYKYSDMRAWLNSTFYNMAFDELQKEIVLLTTVDNSAATTSSSSNSHVCENTEDYVWLPSYKESRSPEYGFSSNEEERKKQGSDYANCQGYGSYYWWTRSPHANSNGRHFANGQNEDIIDTRITYSGILPVIRIDLDF